MMLFDSFLWICKTCYNWKAVRRIPCELEPSKVFKLLFTIYDNLPRFLFLLFWLVYNPSLMSSGNVCSKYLNLMLKEADYLARRLSIKYFFENKWLKNYICQILGTTNLVIYMRIPFLFPINH